VFDALVHLVLGEPVEEFLLNFFVQLGLVLHELAQTEYVVLDQESTLFDVLFASVNEFGLMVDAQLAHEGQVLEGVKVVEQLVVEDRAERSHVDQIHHVEHGLDPELVHREVDVRGLVHQTLHGLHRLLVELVLVHQVVRLAETHLPVLNLAQPLQERGFALELRKQFGDGFL